MSESKKGNRFWIDIAGDFLTGALGLGLDAATGAINSAYSKDLNEYNAQLQNKYWNLQNDKLYEQSEQTANNAMQRTINLYNLLQSPSALVQQYKDAGLNPALLYGMGGSGGKVTTGPQGNGGQNASGISTLGIQQFMANNAMTWAQIANINADTKKKEKETTNIEQDTALKRSTELLNIQTKDQNERQFAHKLAILIAEQAVIENDATMSETKNQLTNKQLEILENEALLRKYEVELEKRFRDKGWDLGSMSGLGSLFIQMGDKLINILKKFQIELPEWMIW